MQGASERELSEAQDLEKGRLSIGSPLGKAILGAEEGDEIELSLENGHRRKLLIESVEKSDMPLSGNLGQMGSAENATAVA